MIKKIFFILVCFTSVQLMYTQEEASNTSGILASDIPLHNSLKYNRFFFNPTFSLVREKKNSINIYNRNPRATFTDNSQTYFLNYSARFEEKMGIGIGLFQQNVGIFRFFGATANYAYNVELDRDMNFTFGLNLQYSQSSLKSNLDNAQANDEVINNYQKNSVFLLHPGVNFNYGSFDVGVSVGNLVAYNLTSSELITDNFVYSGHLMYTTELDWRTDNEIRGMAYASKPGQEALRYGGNVLFEIPKYGWAQLGYNSFFGAAIGIGANITKMVSVGYTVEPGIGGEASVAEFGATHEFGLAFNFEQEKRKDERRGSSNKAYEARDSELRRLKKEILQQNKLIRTLKGSSGDSLSQAQRSMSKLQRSIEEAKEEEEKRARRLALQREEEVKLLNKEEEERLSGSKKLQLEMSEQKIEEERQRLAASNKKLQLEMSEQTNAKEEERIALEEAEREAEAAKQEEALEAAEELKRQEQVAIAARQEEARLAEQEKIAIETAKRVAAEEEQKQEEIRIAEEKAEAERIASRKKLEREVQEQKEAAEEAERIASRKKLEREVQEQKAAEEARIAAEETARQEAAEAARIAAEETARQEAAAEAARIAAEETARQEAAAEEARIAAEETARQEAAAEAARIAAEETARQEAAEAERLAAEEAARIAAANSEPEEDITNIQKEIDNSSRITKKLIASRDSLLNSAANLDKREFSKLLESLVNMGDQAEEVKNENDLASSKKLKSKNRFIKFAEATRPEARYATKFIPGYPEGYYLIGNVFQGGVYADKFTGKLKELGFNDAQIILNPENQYQYVSIADFRTKEEASENYFNNIGNKYFGNIWILKIAKNRVESMKRLVQESKIIKNTVQDDTVLTESLSYIGGHNIETGYYLITNIFKRENYFERGMANLKAKGLEPKFFRNPKDNYIYVYLERYDDLDNAKQSLFSNVNNKYDGELYILKIQ